MKYMRKNIFLIISFIFISIICFGQDYFPQMSSQNDSIYDKTFFFQDFDKELLLDTAFNNKISPFCNAWYSKHLKVLEEPIIYSDKSDKEIIRFTWLRTFHNPIVIRIENSNGIYSIYWKKSNGAGGYSPGNLVINEEKQIDIQQWTDIVNQLNECVFWEIPTNYPTFGFDGAQWILEAKIDGKYHIVDRWSGKKSEIGQFCLNLFKMTNLNIKKSETY